MTAPLAPSLAAWSRRIALLAGLVLSSGCSVLLSGGRPDGERRPRPAKPEKRERPEKRARSKRPALATVAARPELDRDMAAAARALEARRLMVPVAGARAARIPDSFHERRSGGRIHQAVDILAPRGTPVLSADDGRVIRLSRSSLGGITVYAVDGEERFVYYYAHLDRYRDGLAEGTKVAKGEVIGYVGTTGNAPKDTPHLHFQVMRLDDPARWWDGTPLDPRPYFALDGAEQR